MELMRGTVEERPWGVTLATIAARGLSGQLIVADLTSRYCIAFEHGDVVGATSSHPDDATLRLAIGAGVVSPLLARELTVLIATHRDRIDFDIIARHVGLDDEATRLLRRRVVAHRATRTFALERGRYTFEDKTTIPISAGCELDTRAVIYHGARHHIAADRLAGELAQFGSFFALRSDATDRLPQFGFGYREAPIVDHLMRGAVLRDLEHAHVDLDLRTIHAVVYSLVSCSACDARTATAPASAPPPPTDFAQGTVRGPALSPSPTAAIPQPQRAPTTPGMLRQPPSGAARRKLLATLERRIAAGVDHFTLLGLPFGASRADARLAYLDIARQLHPDLGQRNEAALRVFVEVGKAFSILTDVARRAAYFTLLGREDVAERSADVPAKR